MKKLILSITLFSSLISLAQNKLEAKTLRYFDDQGNVTYQDSTVYAYDNFQLYALGTFKPQRVFDGGAYLMEFVDKAPNFATADYYTNDPFSLESEFTNTFTNQLLTKNERTSNGNPLDKSEFQYDANGNVINESYYFYNGNNYELSSTIDYVYDANGNKKVETYSYSNNGTLVVDQIDSFFYDAANNPIEYLSYYDNNGNLILGSKAVTFYTNNLPTLGYILEENNGALDSIFKLTYTFENNHLTLLEGYPYIGSGFSPVPLGFFSYTYDDINGNLIIEESSFDFDGQRVEYEYNTEQQVKKYTSYVVENGNLEVDLIGEYYFQSVANLAENNAVDFSLYPNPVTEVLTINTQAKIKNISVYNMNGMLLVSQNKNAVHVHTLPAGNYTVVVSTDNGTAQKRFIKQ